MHLPAITFPPEMTNSLLPPRTSGMATSLSPQDHTDLASILEAVAHLLHSPTVSSKGAELAALAAIVTGMLRQAAPRVPAHRSGTARALTAQGVAAAGPARQVATVSTGQVCSAGAMAQVV